MGPDWEQGYSIQWISDVVNIDLYCIFRPHNIILLPIA